MQIENHKEEVPFAHYCERFAALDPQEAAARTGTPFENGAFRITLLGHPYRITHPEFSISGEGGTALKSLPAQTFLMRWLLEGKQTAGSRDFLTFREMPWGELYIQPFTGRVLQRAAFSFGTRLEAFRAACTAMGGLPLQAGDAGFEFTLLGNYRLRMLLWAGIRRRRGPAVQRDQGESVKKAKARNGLRSIFYGTTPTAYATVGERHAAPGTAPAELTDYR